VVAVDQAVLEARCVPVGMAAGEALIATARDLHLAPLDNVLGV